MEYHCIMNTNVTAKLYAVLKRMRELSEAGVPFSFEFYSYQESKNLTEGYKIVEKATLRTGLSPKFSDKADVLIGYTNAEGDRDRFFYLPLLIKFNNKYIDEY